MMHVTRYTQILKIHFNSNTSLVVRKKNLISFATQTSLKIMHPCNLEDDLNLMMQNVSKHLTQIRYFYHTLTKNRMASF